MTKKFVIVIDTQFDFMMSQGKLYVQDAEHTIVPGIAYLQSLTPEDTAGVLFTYDTHDAETYYDMPESKQFPIHCERLTTGWQNVFNADLINSDVQVYDLHKGVFNMWEENNVKIEHHYGEALVNTRDAFFDELKANGVDTVVVIGVALNFCVKWAVNGLVERGFKVELPANLTVGIDTGKIEDTIPEECFKAEIINNQLIVV